MSQLALVGVERSVMLAEKSVLLVSGLLLMMGQKHCINRGGQSPLSSAPSS